MSEISERILAVEKPDLIKDGEAFSKISLTAKFPLHINLEEDTEGRSQAHSWCDTQIRSNFQKNMNIYWKQHLKQMLPKSNKLIFY